MPPATLLPLPRRRRDEGDLPTLPHAAPTILGSYGSTPSAPCARRPSAAPLRCAPRIRLSNRCRMRARPSGIARTRPGSSSSSCCRRMLPAIAFSTSASRFLFNSYYVAAGPRHARPKRGLITRPDCAESRRYRAHVDAAVERLIDERRRRRTGRDRCASWRSACITSSSTRS